jgi:hypothetical protein
VTSTDLVFFFTLLSTQLSRDPAWNRKKKKERERERPKKSYHQKKFLFPAGICLFTSTVNSRTEGSTSCHGQDCKMKIEEVRGLVEVEELRVTGLESLRMK